MPRLLRRPSRPAQQPMDIYLREINDTPLLDADEERELAYRVEEGGHRGPRPHGPRQPASGR